jgi:cyclophilin family peptidyl-prolyl cis-trans isomerase
LKDKPAGKPIRNESSNGLSNQRGTIACARTSNPESATSQFYINHKDNSFLDATEGKPGYTVFGRVVKGMDVVDRIAAQPTRKQGVFSDVPVTPVHILSVTVEE